MKRKWMAVGLLLLLVGCGGCVPGAGVKDKGSSALADTEGHLYGVFLGMEPDAVMNLTGYDLLVIDGAYFTGEEIARLKAGGSRVYSYLNVGSLETFRPFFSDFSHLILAPYEDWPEEYWVDVTAAEWQEQVLAQGTALAEKGVDGFFIDNTDVYDHSPTPAVLQSLVDLLTALGGQGQDLIVNGGDVFVRAAVLSPPQPLVTITGVNQECVFTSIDFEGGRLTEQEEETRQYYQQYVEDCRAEGLAVYLLEYADTDRLLPEIASYCEAQDFIFFLAPAVELDGEAATNQGDGTEKP